MASAELALALPALVLVLALVLGAVGAGIDRVRCVDAARLGARALARGDPPGSVGATVAGAAPSGARVTTSVMASQVTVTVAVRRSLPLLGWGADVSASAVADRERTDAEDP